MKYLIAVSLLLFAGCRTQAELDALIAARQAELDVVKGQKVSRIVEPILDHQLVIYFENGTKLTIEAHKRYYSTTFSRVGQ